MDGILTDWREQCKGMEFESSEEEQEQEEEPKLMDTANDDEGNVPPEQLEQDRPLFHFTCCHEPILVYDPTKRTFRFDPARVPKGMHGVTATIMYSFAQSDAGRATKQLEKLFRFPFFPFIVHQSPIMNIFLNQYRLGSRWASVPLNDMRHIQCNWSERYAGFFWQCYTLGELAQFCIFMGATPVVGERMDPEKKKLCIAQYMHDMQRIEQLALENLELSIEKRVSPEAFVDGVKPIAFAYLHNLERLLYKVLIEPYDDENTPILDECYTPYEEGTYDDLSLDQKNCLQKDTHSFFSYRRQLYEQVPHDIPPFHEKQMFQGPSYKGIVSWDSIRQFMLMHDEKNVLN